MTEIPTLYIPQGIAFYLLDNPDAESSYAGTTLRLGHVTEISPQPFDYADSDGEPLHSQRISLVDGSNNVWISTLIYKCVVNYIPVRYRLFEYFYLYDKGDNDE